MFYSPDTSINSAHFIGRKLEFVGSFRILHNEGVYGNFYDCNSGHAFCDDWNNGQRHYAFGELMSWAIIRLVGLFLENDLQTLLPQKKADGKIFLAYVLDDFKTIFEK